MRQRKVRARKPRHLRPLLDLSRDAPGRSRLPTPKLIQRPLIRFVCVAGGAGIWNFELFCQARRNKLERVRADHVVTQCLLNLRHVARRALACGTIRGVMRMFRNRSFQTCRACSAIGTVAGHAKIISGFS